jgi:hypothetical protein
MKLLLFALGMGAGLILAAIVGLLTGVLFSCLLIIAAIGVLLDNLFEEEMFLSSASSPNPRKFTII